MAVAGTGIIDATSVSVVDEDFYGDSDYNDDELDTDGFVGLDGIADDYSEDIRY
jgi:hypothetical protein